MRLLIILIFVISISVQTCQSRDYLKKIAKAADYILVAEEKMDSLGLAPRMVIIIGDKTTPQFQGKTAKEKK